MKNVINKLFIGVFFASSVFAAPTIWDGTADESWYWNNRNSQTYTLTTASQLAGLAKIVNRELFSFRGRTIILDADIFLNDTTGAGAGTWGDISHRNWVPIGTKDLPFKGVFDGSAGTDNHRIYGLYMNSASDSYAGLFGRTDSAKIINLDIPVGKVSSNNFVGTLIGRANYSEISNVRVKAEINGSNSVGGLVGGGYSTIIDSYYEGNVTGADYVGGLAGSCSKIIASHSSGMITGGNFVGGLTGNSGTVKDSYFKGDVKGADRVGGVAGQGEITNSHSEGNVTGANYVGGLCGASNYITDSYFEGSVAGTDSVGGLVGAGRVSSSHSIGTVTGSNYVGGLAGVAHWGNKENFDNSYFQGSVIASENFVGGLVGLGVRYSLGEYVLENSYAIANVEGFDYVGGLIGNDSVEGKSFSYADIRISNCYSHGNIKGNSYVGGIIGKSSNGTKKYGSEFIIVACHHSGSVSGNSDYVGGIIGHNNDRSWGCIDSSFHDGGDVRGINYVGGLVGYYDSLSVLTNSHSKGNIFGSGSYVGGLAGYIKNISLLSNSYSKGNITGTGSYVGGICGLSQGDTVDYVKHSGGNVDGEDYVGGLFGYGHFGQVNHSYHDEGNVGGKKYIGGVIGLAALIKDDSKKGVLKNAFSIGDVHGKGLYTGGMIGYLSYGDVDSSYHVGNVDSEGRYTGGLVGYCYGYRDQNSTVVLEIRNSYATGDYVKGENHVGGAVGLLRRTCSIHSSYYDGDSVVGVSNVGGLVGEGVNISDSYSTADILGIYSVGGLVGQSTGSVKNSYALGDVSGSNRVGGLVGVSWGAIYKSWTNGTVWGDSAVGGLVGILENVSSTDSYSITDSYVNGNVKGNFYVGGLVGNGRVSSATRSCPVYGINRNYVSGTVSVSDEENVSFGCIFGYISADSSTLAGSCGWNLDKSYYDSDKCNLGVYGEFYGRGHLSGFKSQAKTTAEMQTQSTFEQWDFTDVWAISENSYPYHQKFAKFLPNADVEIDSLSGFMYDGLPKMPLVKSVLLWGHELKEGADYTVEYKHNLDAGIARIKVCGINAYSGCKIVKFEIAPVPMNLTIMPIENMVYTGVELTPNITVYNGGFLLGASNYTVEYTNNLNAGTAFVNVILKGNYSGTATATFTIEKADPVISQNPKASDVLIGESLAVSELLNGVSSTEGAFVWMTPEVKPTLKNEGYAVKFIPADAANYNSVEIVIPIKVWDIAYVVVRLGNMTLDSVVVRKGSTYALPMVSDSVGYDFEGFYNGNLKVGDSGSEIVVNDNTIVDAVYKIKMFAVKFVDGKTELQSEELAYGSLPEYKGDSLTKTATEQWAYSFKGWKPAISEVTENVEYVAEYDSTVRSYAIVFKNGSEVLQSSDLEYGVEPVYKGETPTKTATAQYTYTFNDWNPELATVSECATYAAVFDSVVNKYVVTFVNGGKTLQTDSLLYGEVPKYKGDSSPVKASTEQYNYTFKGWNPAIESVSKNTTYTAIFDSTLRKYTVTFKNGTTTLQTSDVAYGSKPSYSGDTPTKTSTDKYSYTFKGWSPTLASVTGTTTYAAVFDSTLRKYTITFKNGSTTLQTSDVAYGVKPSYTGTTPTKKATNKYTYKFKGWNPAIATVTKAATYQAVFDSTKVTGIVEGRLASLGLSVRAVSRSIQISAAPKNSTYAVLDMQGRVLLSGRVESANFNIAVPNAGSYLVRVGNATRKVQVK